MIVRDIVSDIVRNVARDPWGKGQAIPEWMMLGWNLFQSDPIVGQEPVFSVASSNYDENGNNIGNNPSYFSTGDYAHYSGIGSPIVNTNNFTASTKPNYMINTGRR